MKKLSLTLFACVIFANIFGQNYNSPFIWNLMDEKTYDFIAGETSGDLAYNMVLDMAGYEKDRKTQDYLGNFHETDYVLAKMKEYGLPGATVERYSKTKSWDGISASLWEISPKMVKIADYLDMAAILGSGSKNANVEAELVWVGRGTAQEIIAANVKGKIVVTESSPRGVHDFAIDNGAVGIISFSSARPLVDPIQVPNTGIGGDKATFCFNIPPRDGYLLRDRLLSGEKIVVRAKVEAQFLETDIQVPTCYIPGTDPDAEQIIYVAHLFEGYTKLGANDNTSGCVVLLDIARTLHTLIENGSIPRPKRTLRFIWGPEFSGTGPWVKAHADITSKALCAFNLDMVGLWLSKSESYYCVHRTTMSAPHYLNDVSEAFFHYMGATNKFFTATGVGRPDPVKPVYSLTGSRDPFYYSINSHYGASDHEVFNDWGVQVPSIIMITWPDNYYHTSGDRPSILDPTQLKRAAVIGAVSGYYIANAGLNEAIKIASEVTSNASKRISIIQGKGTSFINDATASDLLSVYRKALWDIDAQQLNEKLTLKSVSELVPTDAKELTVLIETQTQSINESAKAAKISIDAVAKAKAAQLGITLPKVLPLTEEEKSAAKIFPKATAKVLEGGYGVIRSIPMELREKYKVDYLQSAAEAAKLTTSGALSILDIKKAMEAQFPMTVDINTLRSFMDLLKEVGLVTF